MYSLAPVPINDTAWPKARRKMHRPPDVSLSVIELVSRENWTGS